jgi:hypothetical protein
MMTRKEITECSHPLYWKFVKDDKNMDNIYYLCEQKDFLILAVGLWGTTRENAKKEFTNHDFIHLLVGVLLQESF